VRVVAAGVFDARHERFVRHVNRFIDRQCVHVRSHANHWPGLPALEQTHDAVLGDAGFDFVETQGAEPFGDHPGGALFAIAQFRVLMKIPPRWMTLSRSFSAARQFARPTVHPREHTTRAKAIPTERS